jgi:hypothetical protein
MHESKSGATASRAQINRSRAAWTACEGIRAAEQIGGYLRTGREPAPITERDPISGPTCHRTADSVLGQSDWLSREAARRAACSVLPADLGSLLGGVGAEEDIEPVRAFFAASSRPTWA